MQNIKIPVKQGVFNILISILKNLFQLTFQQVALFSALLITYLVSKPCNDLERMNFNLLLLRLLATKISNIILEVIYRYPCEHMTCCNSNYFNKLDNVSKNVSKEQNLFSYLQILMVAFYIKMIIIRPIKFEFLLPQIIYNQPV